MKEIDLDNLTRDNLIEHEALSVEFKKYLMKVLKYSKSEAEFVVSNDFENPYDTPYIVQRSEGSVTVDGKEYEVRYCYTEYRICGFWHLAEKPPFEFYMFIDPDDLPDGTVGSYSKAKKLYLI